MANGILRTHDCDVEKKEEMFNFYVDSFIEITIIVFMQYGRTCNLSGFYLLS